ncbi:hypothetical protein FO519_009115 [Halicephalobus sp. NKZ332]|nr:hypothetical protein FO519_009115 [Halicephalobus sp. NKZ332]
MLRILKFRPALQARFLSNSSRISSPLQAPEIRRVVSNESGEYNDFQKLYNESINNPSEFWRRMASELHFEKVSDNGLEFNFDPTKGDVFVKFMEGSITNMAYNCLERNIIRGLGNKIAYKWEGNVVGDESSLTYNELHRKVLEFARVLKTRGVKKGDVVAIYLPMIMELPVAMLACARLGAIHSVVFAGFSANSLAERIKQSDAKVLITCDGFFRGQKFIHLKSIADDAVQICKKEGHLVSSSICLEHLKNVSNPSGNTTKVLIRDEENWELAKADSESVRAPVEWCDAEDPLFILHTSGSSGTPKGIVHSTAGYMTSAYCSTKTTFDIDLHEDVYWSMADIGWITGHTYGVYGPLLNGITSVIFEGVPSFPDFSRTWQIVGKHKVSKLYTSPTAVRSMKAHPDELVKKYDRSKLKIVGTVGEPMNSCSWKWLNEVVGEKNISIVDTYWQTETGCHLLTGHPTVAPQDPSCSKVPFLGVVPQILDEHGHEVLGSGQGTLVVDRAWPGMMRTIHKNHKRFVETYFSRFPGYYFTGDNAQKEDEYYRVTGRVDDLMNVSGHLLSTAEIESVVVSHPEVVEAAVVPVDHSIKGHVPYIFAAVSESAKLSKKIADEIKSLIRKKVGAVAVPDNVQLVTQLPKTRSGKIIRRMLKKVAKGDKESDLGDMTTLHDESVMKELWQARARLSPQ